MKWVPVLGHTLGWTLYQTGEGGLAFKALVGERPHRRKTSELRKTSRQEEETFTCDVLVAAAAAASSLSFRPRAEGLEGRSVADDVLASAREQLHLPVPGVRVHCRGSGGRAKGQRVICATQMLPCWSITWRDAPMQIPVPVIGTDTGVEYQDTNTSYIM